MEGKREPELLGQDLIKENTVPRRSWKSAEFFQAPSNILRTALVGENYPESREEPSKRLKRRQWKSVFHQPNWNSQALGRILKKKKNIVP